MPGEYTNLTEMLSKCYDAGNYFSGLPDYVQEHISSRGDSVKTLESLRDYAENLLRGDN